MRRATEAAVFVLAVLAGVACVSVSGMSAPARAQGQPQATMALPKDFRQWVFLTSGYSMSYDASTGAEANPRFENVFVNPSAYRAYLRTGTWPDKTVLVLESRNSDSKLSINRNGRVQTTPAGISVHVKDTAQGGWSFYAFKSGAEHGNLIPKGADCYSC